MWFRGRDCLTWWIKSCPLGGQTDPSSRAQGRRVVCSPTALALVLSLKCASPLLCDVRDFSAGEQMREKHVEPAARAGKDLSPSGELQVQKWA